MINSIKKPKHQSGAVMIVCMVLIVALSVLGSSIVKMQSNELRLASNSQNRQIAFTAAEALIEQIREETTIDDLQDVMSNGAKTNIKLRNIKNQKVDFSATGSISWRHQEDADACDGWGATNNSTNACQIFEVQAIGVHEPSGSTATIAAGYYMVSARNTVSGSP